MKIVVAVRCYNEAKNIRRFMRGYDFADEIVVSDGGSKDASVSILKEYPKVRLLHFAQQETVNRQTWNPDAPHMNFVLDAAKALKPDWLIFDDMDCVPNAALNQMARFTLENAVNDVQVNAFRLYMWGDKEYFPYMNRNFDPIYTSLWAWRPDRIDIRADESIRHGTLMGLDTNPMRLEIPYCLLHKSWNPKTINKKIKRYNTLGIPMTHPLEHPESYGVLADLPLWAVE